MHEIYKFFKRSISPIWIFKMSILTNLHNFVHVYKKCCFVVWKLVNSLRWAGMFFVWYIIIMHLNDLPAVCMLKLHVLECDGKGCQNCGIVTNADTVGRVLIASIY